MNSPAEVASEAFELVVAELAETINRTTPAIPADPADQVAWIHERIRHARGVFAATPHRIDSLYIVCGDLELARRAAETWDEPGIGARASRKPYQAFPALRDGELRLWIFAAWDPARQDPNDQLSWLMGENSLTGIAPTPAQQQLIADSYHLERAWALGPGYSLEEALEATRPASQKDAPETTQQDADD